MRVRSNDGEEYGMRPLTGALRHRQHVLFRIHSPVNKRPGLQRLPRQQNG